VNDPVIDVTDLVKTFGATRALDGLALSVAPAEVHGFLGARRGLRGRARDRSDAGAVLLTGAAWWRFRERDIG
jgi:ABC-2 type transport system ATP-binding protein